MTSHMPEGSEHAFDRWGSIRPDRGFHSDWPTSLRSLVPMCFRCEVLEEEANAAVLIDCSRSGPKSGYHTPCYGPVAGCLCIEQVGGCRPVLTPTVEYGMPIRSSGFQAARSCPGSSSQNSLTPYCRLRLGDPRPPADIHDFSLSNYCMKEYKYISIASQSYE